jgi:hypothetical protein
LAAFRTLILALFEGISSAPSLACNVLVLEEHLPGFETTTAFCWQSQTDGMKTTPSQFLRA